MRQSARLDQMKRRQVLPQSREVELFFSHQVFSTTDRLDYITCPDFYPVANHS
jgi:hypothetical protein